MNRKDKIVNLDLLSENKDGSYDIVISTEVEDRHGDIIEIAGWKTGNYMNNPIVLWGHDYRGVPLGLTRSLTTEANRLIANFSFREPANDFDPVMPIKSAWDQGILRAASVGFDAIKVVPIDDDADPWWGPFRFKEQELLEWSIVSVPANQEALRLGFEAYVKSLGRVDERDRAEELLLLSADAGDLEARDKVQEEVKTEAEDTNDELTDDVLKSLFDMVNDLNKLLRGKDNA